MEARAEVALGRRRRAQLARRLEDATTSTCSCRRRRSPASRCTRSGTPRRRTSSTRPASARDLPLAVQRGGGRAHATRSDYVRRSARRSSTSDGERSDATSTMTTRSWFRATTLRAASRRLTPDAVARAPTALPTRRRARPASWRSGSSRASYSAVVGVSRAGRTRSRSASRSAAGSRRRTGAPRRGSARTSAASARGA